MVLWRPEPEMPKRKSTLPPPQYGMPQQNPLMMPGMMPGMMPMQPQPSPMMMMGGSGMMQGMPGVPGMIMMPQQPPPSQKPPSDTTTATPASSVLEESTSEDDSRPRAKVKSRKQQKKWHQGVITSSSTFVGKISPGRICAILEFIDPRYTSSMTAEFDPEQAAVILWFDPSLEYKADGLDPSYNTWTPKGEKGAFSVRIKGQ